MKVILCAFLAGTVAFNSAASAGKLCDDKSGSARTRCLEAERERGQRELDEINRKNKNLDRAIQATCVGRAVGGAVAGKAGGVAGAATWAGTTAAGDAVTKNGGCK